MLLKIKKGGNIQGLKAGQKSIKIIKKRFHQIKIKKASQEEGHVQDLKEITNQKDNRLRFLIKNLQPLNYLDSFSVAQTILIY